MPLFMALAERVRSVAEVGSEGFLVGRGWLGLWVVGWVEGRWQSHG